MESLGQIEQPFRQYAVVEIFGHTRIAGEISEAQIGGCSFVRVDVPEVDGAPAFTRYYGNGAIYSMTIVDYDVMIEAIKALRPRAITSFMLPQLSAPVYDQRDTSDDDDLSF